MRSRPLAQPHEYGIAGCGLAGIVDRGCREDVRESRNGRIEGFGYCSKTKYEIETSEELSKEFVRGIQLSSAMCRDRREESKDAIGWRPTLGWVSILRPAVQVLRLLAFHLSHTCMHWNTTDAL
jgi:hypothetical protein